MEFQEFCKVQKRMCEWAGEESCIKCPLYRANISCPGFFEEYEVADVEQIVEQWAKENLIITNGEKFQQLFGVNLSTIREINEKSFVEWLDAEYQPPKGE